MADKKVEQSRVKLYNDAVKHKMFFNATPSLDEFNRRLDEVKGYADIVYDNYTNQGVRVGSRDEFKAKLGVEQKSTPKDKAVSVGVGYFGATGNAKGDVPSSIARQDNYTRPGALVEQLNQRDKEAEETITEPLRETAKKVQNRQFTPQKIQYVDENNKVVDEDEVYPVIPKEIAEDELNRMAYDRLNVVNNTDIDAQIAALDKETKDVFQNSVDNYKRGQKPKSLWGRMADVGTTSAMPSGTREYMDMVNAVGNNPEYKNRVAALNLLKQASYVKRAAEQSKKTDVENKKGVGDWIDDTVGWFKDAGFGMKEAAKNVSTWDMGATTATDAKALYDAAQKFDNGEKLSESEQQLLNAAATYSAFENAYGKDVSSGVKAGQVTMEALPFMAEMLVNPASGTGRALQKKFIGKGMTELVKNMVKSIAKKEGRMAAAKELAGGTLARVGGDLLGAAVMTGTTGAQSVAGDTYRRMQGKSKYGVDVNGNIKYAGHEIHNYEWEPWTAFEHAFLARTIENHSEMVGAYFAPALGIGGKVLEKGLSKMKLGGVVDFIKSMGATKGAKLVDNFFEKTKWDGTIGEYAEEVVGGIENALVVGDQTLDTDPDTGVFNGQQNLETFLSVALMGGFLSTFHTGVGALSYVKGKQQLNRADYLASEALGEEWSGIKQTIDHSTAENASANLSQILSDPNMSPEQKQAVREYAKRKESLRGVLYGEESRKKEKAQEKAATRPANIDVAADGQTVVQKNQNGEVISEEKFDDEEEAKAHVDILKMQRAEQDFQDDLATAMEMSEQRRQAVENGTPDDFPLSEEMEARVRAMAINQIIPEGVEEGSPEYEAFVRNMDTPGTAENDILLDMMDSFDPLEDTYETVAVLEDSDREEIDKAIKTDPVKRTERQQKLVSEFAWRLHQFNFPKGELHPEQSYADGQTQAELDGAGTMEADPEAMLQMKQSMDDAQQALDDAVAQNTDLAAYVNETINSNEPFAPEDVISGMIGRFSDDEIATVADYINAQSKLDGYLEYTNGKIQQYVERETSKRAFKGKLNGAPSGNMVMVTDGENRYFLVNGDVQVGENGEILSAGEANGIVVVDEEGNIMPMGLDSSLRVEMGATLEEYASSLLQQQQENTTAQMGFEAPQENGNNESDESNESNGTETETPPLTPPEGEETPEEEVEEAPQETEQEETVSDEKISEIDAALAKIPTRSSEKDSEPDYIWEDAPAEDTIDALTAINDGNLDAVSETATMMRKEAESELKKAEKLKTSGKNPIEMAKSRAENKQKVEEAQKRLDYWKAVEEQVKGLIKQAEEAPLRQAEEEDASTRAAIIEEKSDNDAKWKALHQLYDGTIADDGEILDESRPMDINELVAMNMPRNIAWESYTVDGTHVKRGLQDELGSHHTRGIGKNVGTNAFNTFLAKKGTGISIDEAIHQIWESGENELANGEKRFSDQEIRNAVIDMFLSAERPSDITNYVVNNRSRLANEKLRQEEEYMREQEANAYADAEAQARGFADANEEADYNEFIAEEIKLQAEYEQRTEEGTAEQMPPVAESAEGGEQGEGGTAESAGTEREVPLSEPGETETEGNTESGNGDNAADGGVHLEGRESTVEPSGEPEDTGAEKPAEQHIVDNVDKAPKSIKWSEKTTDKGYTYKNVQLGVDGNDLYIRQTGTYANNPRKEIIYKVKDYKSHSINDVLLDIIDQTDAAVPRHVEDALRYFYRDNGINPNSILRPAFTPSTEEVKEEPKKEVKNPSGNKLVTDERYEELKKRMRDKLLGQMNIGVDPEILALGVEMAVYHIEKGARKFAEYAKAMIEDMGDVIRPYLKAFYNGARDLPEMEELSKEMDDYGTVQSFDVANFDKQTADPMAQAQQIRDEEKVEKDAETAKESLNYDKQDSGTVNVNKKENKKKKKSVSLQEIDLFNQNTENNEQEIRRNNGLQEEPVSSSEGEGQESGEPERVREGGSPEQDRSEQSGLSDTVEETEAEPQPQEKKNQRNNRNERGKDYAPTSATARVNANIAAIELLKRLEEENRDATPEEMAVLKQYSGWGGLGGAFNENSPLYNKVREVLDDAEYDSAAMSINSAYFTPASVIDRLWDVAAKLGFKGGNILESSAGIGNIIASIPESMNERSDIEMVEIDSISGRILAKLYPDAKVNIKGFEDTKIENGSIDLAITNVPFVTGLKVRDEVDTDLSRQFGNIHDFVIAKNIRKLKEGGIGIFITTSNTLDKSDALREWIDNKGDADVMGVFRLNNATFEGTTVTSDIIVVRKRVNGERHPDAIDVKRATVVREGEYEDRNGKYDWKAGRYETKRTSMKMNAYLSEHPENMGGEMAFAYEKGDTFRPGGYGLYPSADKSQVKMLDEWVSKMKDVFAAVKQQPAVKTEDTEVREGRMFVKNGKIYVSQKGKAVPYSTKKAKVKGKSVEECAKDYVAIRESLGDVLKYQLENEGDEGLKPLLDKLNKAYDNFVRKYGYLHKNVAISFLRDDIEFPDVAALENYSESKDMEGNKIVKVGKSKVFEGRVLRFKTEPKPQSVKDGVLASVQQFGRIDIPWIASVLPSKRTEQDVKAEILREGYGFEDPITRKVEVRYEYLSGNVREKLRQARENNEDGRYDKNIEELEKVVPMDIPAHLIDFQLGSSWVDPKLYEDYVWDKYGCRVKFVNIGGAWNMEVLSGEFGEKNRAGGVFSRLFNTTIPASKLVEAAINNRTVKVQRTEKNWDGTKETITDKEASQSCQNRIGEIKDEFTDWAKARMQEDVDMAEKMMRVYNDKFNAMVPKEVDDTFIPEQFEGAASYIHLYPHQSKAVMRAITEPVMLAHQVGAGKTFTLITTAMEMRRLGTAKKPMIVVQNATVGQFVAAAKTLYPNAKILSLTEKDRDAEGRRAFYGKIKYNDWDMIVIPQSTFERIPDSPERQLEFIQEKIDDKMHALDVARQANADSRLLNQMEKDLEDLENEYADVALGKEPTKKKGKKKDEEKTKQNVAARAKEQLDRHADDVMYFDEMGIDALLIDEAHEYKRLGFSTTMTRGVKGIDPAGSKKSAGVYLKSRGILKNNGWKNVVFATGTPISNTAAEIWTFMRYLMPREVMEANEIWYFDDFVHNFGKVSQSLEFATNGKFKENTRFAAYINKPELIRIWSTVADTVLAKDMPEVDAKLPSKENGKDQDVFLPQTQSLIGIMKAVRKRLEEFEKMSGAEKRANSSIPLVMYGLAKRAAIDPRLVDEGAVDEPNSKTNKAVGEVVKDLKDTERYKGTVAIFCDMQNGPGGFNIFQEMKRKLMEQGIPENQIAIITSGMTINAKEKIFEQVNSGDIRVIMGSTQTLGTGVNIQERLHLLIHMDAPDRPMDYTQRNGRILRQGNLHKDWGLPVRILRFGVEDSLDVTSYQRLKTKSGFIDSIMDGKAALQNNQVDRTLEEEEERLFDNPVAVLSGSQYALKKTQAERELRKWQSKKQQWESDQIYIENTLRRNNGQNRKDEENIKEYEKQIELAKQHFPEGKATTITIKGVETKTQEELDKAITEQVNKPIRERVDAARKDVRFERAIVKIPVKFDDLTITVEAKITRETEYVQGKGVKTTMHTVYAYKIPELGLVEYSPTRGYMKDVIDDIKSDIAAESVTDRMEAARKAIAQRTKDNEMLEARRSPSFKDEDKLDAAREKVAEYTEKMKEEMAEKEAKYAAMDADEVDIEAIQDNAEEEDDDSGTRLREVEEYTEEEQQIIDDAKKNGTYMKAPNGKRTKLSEKQWVRVRTKAFKKWFGDWENDPANASKIVDENGEPKVVYHGSPFGGIESFDRNQNKAEASGLKEFGTYFTTNKALAEMYMRGRQLTDEYHWEIETEIATWQLRLNDARNTTEYEAIEDEIKRLRSLLDGKVYEVFLNIRDPKEFDAKGQDGWHGWHELKQDIGYKTAEGRDAIEAIAGKNNAAVMKEQYDGIIAHNIVDIHGEADEQLSGDVILVFDKDVSKIKSATDNVGTYSSEDEGIRFREGSAAANSQPAEKMKEHLTKLSKKIGTKVVFHDDASTITNAKVKEALQRGKKVAGWYDPKDDSVHFYMPNIKDRYEAEKTIWHEVVGHKGMRALLGEEGYRTFMRRLWMDKSEDFEEMHQWVVENYMRYGGNLYETIDEWFAYNVVEPSVPKTMWDKVLQVLSDVLRKLGFMTTPNMKDMKYMLWLSRNAIREGDAWTELQRNATLAKLDLESRRRAASYSNDGARARDGFSNTPTGDTEREMYRSGLMRKMFAWTEAHQDYMASAKLLMNAILKGRKVLDRFNFYMKENHADSKIKIMEDLYVRDYCKPMEDAINRCVAAIGGKLSEAYEVLEDYMAMKHGLERNREFFVRDWMEEKRKKTPTIDDLDEEAKSEYESAVRGIEQAFEDGTIETEEERDKELKKALEDSYSSMLDRIEEGWAAAKAQPTDNLAEWLKGLDDYIRQHINDKYEAGKHDYSGLTSFNDNVNDNANLEDSYDYDDDAVIGYVMDMESKIGKENVDELWKQKRRMTQFALDIEHEAGLITDKNYDKVSQMFHWYMPLRKWDEDMAEDIWSYMNSKKNTYVGRTLMKAGGRKSRAAMPIGTMFAMGGNAISRAARNEVKKAFAGFVRMYERPAANNESDPLVTELEAWVENLGTEENPDWVYSFPDIPENATADEVREAKDAWAQHMLELMQEGRAMRVRQGDTIPYRFESKKRSRPEHIIEVYEEGQPHFFIVNDNPRAAQAINGQLKPETKHKITAQINRFMSSVFTSYSPTFMARNAFRDAEFASSMLSVKEGWDYCQKFMKNYMKVTNFVGKRPLMFTLFRKFRDGTLDESDKMERYFKEFAENGGITGYVMENNAERWEKEILAGVKEIGENQVVGITKNIIMRFMEGVEHAGEAIENAARFATYVTSRESGRTVTKSVNDAKEVSVNFNRKGAGHKTESLLNEKGEKTANNVWAAKTAQYMRANTLFYNASLQGVMNTVGNAARKPWWFAAKFAIPPMVLGALVPVFNAWVHAMLDDDDDKVSDDPYADLPEYTRRMNMCLYIGHGKFLMIPISIEHRAFFGLGDIMAGQTYDEKLKNVDKPLAVDAVSQLTAFSPVDYNSREMGIEGVTGWGVGLVVPAYISPLVNAYFNKSWKGSQIQRENAFGGSNLPEYQKAKDYTSKTLVGASRMWHELWGGNDAIRAGREQDSKVMEWIGEVSPAKMEYVVEQYFGEPGKLGTGVSDMFSMMFGKKEADLRKIPVVKAFATLPNENTQFRRANTKYWKYRDEFKKVEQDDRQYRSRIDDDPVLKLEYENKFKKSKRYKQWRIYHPGKGGEGFKYKKNIEDLQKRINAEDDLVQKRGLQHERNILVQQLVDTLDNIE